MADESVVARPGKAIEAEAAAMAMINKLAHDRAVRLSAEFVAPLPLSTRKDDVDGTDEVERQERNDRLRVARESEVTHMFVCIGQNVL